MTVSEMPLVSATHAVVADSPGGRVRVRARVPATLRDRNVLAVGRAIYARVLADGRRWWLYAARPVSLAAWWRAQNVAEAQVPGGSARLRVLWLADNWTTGLLMRVLAIALHLAAGGLAYLSGHPARRWVAFGMAFAAVAWAVLG